MSAMNAGSKLSLLSGSVEIMQTSWRKYGRPEKKGEFIAFHGFQVDSR